MKDYLILLAAIVSGYLLYCLLDAWCRAQFDKSIGRLLTRPPEKDCTMADTKEDFLNLLTRDLPRLQAIYHISINPEANCLYEEFWVGRVRADSYEPLKDDYVLAVEVLAEWVKHNSTYGIVLSVGQSEIEANILNLCLSRKVTV